MIQPASLHDQAREAAAAVQAHISVVPRKAVVLGSGMAGLTDLLSDRVVIPYERLPHFPQPSVAGHHGQLVIGTLQGEAVAVFRGRFHYYEGHDLATVTFPIRVMQALGVDMVVLTAAVGAVNDVLQPGTIVMLRDHLNLLGTNPLRGPNDDRLGTRFPDMSEVYSKRLRTLSAAAARACGTTLIEGVYACMPGPSYESPAEVRMLRALGADVVGMSTVPEAIVARHAGMEVAAFALVANWAAGISPRPITHEEVLEAGRMAGPRLAQLIADLIAAGPARPEHGPS